MLGVDWCCRYYRVILNMYHFVYEWVEKGGKDTRHPPQQQDQQEEDEGVPRAPPLPPGGFSEQRVYWFTDDTGLRQPMGHRCALQ